MRKRRDNRESDGVLNVQGHRTSRTRRRNICCWYCEAHQPGTAGCGRAPPQTAAAGSCAAAARPATAACTAPPAARRRGGTAPHRAPPAPAQTPGWRQQGAARSTPAPAGFAQRCPEEAKFSKLAAALCSRHPTGEPQNLSCPWNCFSKMPSSINTHLLHDAVRARQLPPAEATHRMPDMPHVPVILHQLRGQRQLRPQRRRHQPTVLLPGDAMIHCGHEGSHLSAVAVGSAAPDVQRPCRTQERLRNPRRLCK